jgi:uncharacterized membrane protein
VTFANPLPWWVVVSIVAAAALVAGLEYRRLIATPIRRAALVALRFVTLVALVVFLMRPVVRLAGEGERDAVVPILVDSSRSMSIQDVNGRRRIDQARDLLTRALLPVLEPRFHVEVLTFGESMRPAAATDLAATARRSNLSDALSAIRERYRGRPVAGIVLLSDGGDTSGSSEREIQRDRTPPIYPLGIGSSTVGRDREVLSVTAAEAVLDDSRVDLAVSAVSHGQGVEPIELRLLENGRPIEVRRAKPAAEGTPVREVFQVSPGRGAPIVYTVQIPEAAGELVPENNARSTLVQPPSRPRRVLLVAGAPGFEHSFLKRSLAVDPGLQIDSIVRKGKNEEGSDTFYIQAAKSRSDSLTSGYPQQVDALFAYDALVLANVEAAQLSRAQLDATRAFVSERGGGLLVLGARSFQKQGLMQTSIEEVLPLELADRASAVLPALAVQGKNRVALTESGLVHPVMQLGAGADDTRKKWDGAPPLASVAQLGGPRPGATVLAVSAGSGGSPRALVAVQRYGEGRSMVFTGEAAWRWRMMLPASDRSYDTFWRQAVRWLALAAQDPIHVTIPAGGSPGDNLPIRVAVRNAAFQPQRDAEVSLRVAAPDGRIESLRAAPASDQDGGAGVFVARFRAEQPGIYRVSADARQGSAPLGSASTAVLVGGADLEMTDPRLNTQLLARVALASGGRVITAADAQALAGSLSAGVPAARLALQRDLWHNAWSLLLIVGLLTAEWILRRRWGLR